VKVRAHKIARLGRTKALGRLRSSESGSERGNRQAP
jgi:hypothetical protein